MQLIDLIKNSINNEDDHNVFLKNNESINKEIKKQFLQNIESNSKELTESTYFISVDNDSLLKSMTISLFNLPYEHQSQKISLIANEINKKFKNTNVSYENVKNVALFIISSSFYFFQDTDLDPDLLLLWEDDENYKEEIEKLEKKISSIFNSMKIALLDTSMELDGISLASSQADINDDKQVD